MWDDPGGGGGGVVRVWVGLAAGAALQALRHGGRVGTDDGVDARVVHRLAPRRGRAPEHVALLNTTAANQVCRKTIFSM